MSEANGNAAEYFVARHLREGRGDRVAFTDPWRSLTYAELDAASARFAAGLQRAGIERERRIALVMLDTVDFPIAFWGALRAGVVPVPINTLLPADITGYILQDSRAAALFVSAPLLEALKPAARRLGRVVVSSPDGKGGGFADFLAGSPGSDAMAECSPDEVAFWLYSSGSTGMPKGVRHVHSSLQATADTYAASVLGLQRRRRRVLGGEAVLRLRAGQFDDVSDGGGGLVGAVPRPADPGRGARNHARGPPDSVLRGADALRGAAGASRAGAGRRLRPAAPVHLRRRAAARACRAALARQGRLRHPRRHRLDRDAAHLPVEPARRHPLRQHRQGGAGLRAAHRRRGRQRCRATAKAASWWCAAPARPTATGTSAASRG